MAQIPVSMQVIIAPKNKSVAPYPATIVGYLWITGLEVGGGPIIPPDQVPPVEPPLVIWGGPIDPYPDHGLPMPQPPFPPISPPDVVQPPHEGWNWKPSTAANPSSGWFYLFIPGPTDPQPHKKK